MLSSFTQGSEVDDLLPAPRAPVSTAVADFLAGMPAAYAAQFGETAACEHAAIVWRRGDALAHVEQWVDRGKGALWLCVVANDRPGLLAVLSAAVTAHSLNIVEAKVYSRAGNGGQVEAVNLVHVNRLKGGPSTILSEVDLVALRDTIQGVLSGRIDVRQLLRRSSPTSRPAARPEASVYFDDIGTEASRLIVETDDHPGLLAGITTTLFKTGVVIVWSDVATLAGRARDEFHLSDQNGEPLSPERKDAVVNQVSRALGQLEAEQDPTADRASLSGLGDISLLAEPSGVSMAEPTLQARAPLFSQPPERDE